MLKYFAVVPLVLAYSAGNASAFWCFQCTTLNQTNCLVPVQNTLVKECPPSPDVSAVSCYTRIVGKDVERGCATALVPAERDNCTLENNCQFCTNENNTACNGNSFPPARLHCHQCEGNTNSTCAEENQTEVTPCQRFVADDQCIVQVQENKVVRGCLSDHDACWNNPNCHVCSGNGCNSQQFEHYNTTAIWCFTCTTFNNTNCLIPVQNTLLSECPPSPDVTNLSCYTRIVGQDVERGCATALLPAERDNCALVNNCQLCMNENNLACNGNSFPHGRLHCHQCEGNTNSTCAEEIATEATSCLRFVADDQCIVQVRENNVVRGCLSDHEQCRNNRDCHVCSGNGCNFRHFEFNAAAGVVAQIQLLVGAILLSAFVANRM